MRGLPQKQNARRAYKIRLCGHLRRYKKIVKKTYIISTKIIYYNKRKHGYDSMERMYGIAAITSVCILVILIGVLKKNAEVLLNFAARTVVCFLCSHFLNSFFLARGLDVAVGINLISFLTYGTLGISGMAALYGILFLQLL